MTANTTNQPKRQRGQPGGQAHPNYRHGRRSRIIRMQRRAALAEILKPKAANVKIDYDAICRELDDERKRRGWL